MISKGVVPDIEKMTLTVLHAKQHPKKDRHKNYRPWWHACQASTYANFLSLTYTLIPILFCIFRLLIYGVVEIIYGKR